MLTQNATLLHALREALDDLRDLHYEYGYVAPDEWVGCSGCKTCRETMPLVREAISLLEGENNTC